MPKMIDKYSNYEFESNYGIVSSLFGGYLKDKVSEEKYIEIMKKLTLPKHLNQDQSELIGQLQGSKLQAYSERVSDESANEMENKNVEMPGHDAWLQAGLGQHYSNPLLEEGVKIFDDGMRETLELIEQTEHEIDLSDPNARNHFNFLKGILQKSYDGTLAKEISEDAAYGIAVGQTAKIGFQLGLLDYDEKQQKAYVTKNGVDNQIVLKEIADTGLLEGMSGAARVHEKLKDNIATGNTSRQELLNELEEQTKRYDKVMELKEEKVKDLNNKNVLQNDRSEFTDGARGILPGIAEIKAKHELLKIGYPAEDLPAMAAFMAQKAIFEEKINREQKALDKDRRDNPNADEAKKKEYEDRQAQIDRLKVQIPGMEQVWKEITDPSNAPLTQEKRLENLEKLKTQGLQLRTVNGGIPGALTKFGERIDERKNAQLKLGDQALLATNYTEAYNALTQADPRTLLTGSRQFKEFKQAMKELAEMDSQLTAKEKEESYKYRELQRDVMKKAQTYLRYKDRQMNGPDDHKHKRSELETKRVQAVDGIYNKLLADVTRENPHLNLETTEKPILPKIKSNELLTEKPGVEPRNFDEYVLRHSGKGAMSGTKEEMIDDMSKLLAAQIMPAQKPPKAFDPKVIDKAAAQIKDKFNLEQLDEIEIREALNDPKSVKVLAQQHHRKTYGVEADEYQDYLSGMKKLYRDMEEPDGSNKEYQKIYDNVKKIAHLPKDPEAEGLSMKKVGKMVEQANSEIYEAMDRYVDRYGKKIGPKDEKMLQVLSAMSENVPSTEERADRMVSRINDIKGMTKNITSSEHIELEEYGRGKKYGLRKTADKLQLSKNTQAEVWKGLEMDEREKLAYEKAQAMGKAPAKEAGDAIKGKKLEDVETKKKSKEVGDTAEKNAVKKKKEEARNKLNDEISL